MANITLRASKGTPLTHNEVDANFNNLNTDKLDTAGIALGSAASPTIKFTGTNTGIYSPGADQLAVSIGGTGRLFIDSSGRLGVGTSSPSSLLTVYGSNPEVNITQNPGIPGNAGLRMDAAGTAAAYINFRNSSQIWSSTTGGSLFFGNGNRTSTFVTISPTGQLGVGTTSPGSYNANLAVYSAGGAFVGALHANASGTFPKASAISLGSDAVSYTYTTGGSSVALTGSAHIAALQSASSGAGTDIAFINTAGGSVSEKARIDSSGRLLVGTSAARSNIAGVSPGIQLEGANNNTPRSFGQIYGKSDAAGPLFLLAKHRSDSVGGQTVVSSGDELGQIVFTGSDGSNFVQGASIKAEVDGTPGANAMPGRLVFSTTADGASSPTEAMRINSAQELLVGYTSDNGAYKLQVNSQIFATSATIATSDGRYKDNITTLDGCTDLVKALRPVSFDWKPQQDIIRLDEDGNEVLVREGHNFPAGTQVGFIAQEVQSVLTGKPWLGSIIKENTRPAITDVDGAELAPEEQFYGIAEGNLIAVLTSALQEGIARIETLEQQVAALTT